MTARYDPDGRLRRALVRAADPAADRKVKADVALAMVGAATIGDINEIEARIEKMPATGSPVRSVTVETVRQALAHSSRAIVCLKGSFSGDDIGFVLERLDKAAAKEVLSSLRMARPLRLNPLQEGAGLTVDAYGEVTAPDTPAALVEALRRLHVDRVMTHANLFRDRHSDATPGFLRDMIRVWHDPAVARHIFMAFRGSAKSNTSEEALIVRALFREFRFGLIIGAAERGAIDRLDSIASDLVHNEVIESLFGKVQGNVWQAGKIILNDNGACISALGAGMEIRGAKYRNARPSVALLDDIEGQKDASTPDQRVKTRDWFRSDLNPAMSPNDSMVRMATTPLDAESLPIILSRSQAWPMSVVPIKSMNSETGEWQSTWPARYSMEKIDAIERDYASTGNAEEFMREYLCEAVTASERIFKAEYFKIEPMQRGSHPVYVMYDPARTTDKKTSAQTGKAVWSWIGNRLVVWESGGYYWKPDEINEDIFRTENAYRPIYIGVEQNGLHEFLMQPLRHMMIQRGVQPNIKPMMAPRDKIGFIGKLQQFFAAGEVVFVGYGDDNHRQLKEQLLNFPRGLKDVPNALAYAMIMSPGDPVYPEFSASQHVAHGLRTEGGKPLYLLANTDGEECTAQVFQFSGGKAKAVRVIYDDHVSGAPGAVIPDLLRKVALEFGRSCLAHVPPRHYKKFDMLGLVPAIRSAGHATVHTGGDVIKGEAELRTRLGGELLLEIAPRARGTIRALQAGCRTGEPSAAPKGSYELLAEGLESFCGKLLNRASSQNADGEFNAVSMSGRPFLSSIPDTRRPTYGR